MERRLQHFCRGVLEAWWKADGASDRIRSAEHALQFRFEEWLAPSLDDSGQAGGDARSVGPTTIGRKGLLYEDESHRRSPGEQEGISRMVQRPDSSCRHGMD